MSRIISSVFAALAFATTATVVSPVLAHGGGECEGGCGGGWGLDLDLDLGLGLDIDLGDCFDIDIDLGASCAIVTDIDAELYCDPLSVEAACIAELGLDCGLDVFAACVADLTAHCKAEIEAGGALFCDGLFVGADSCLLGLPGIDLDFDECFDDGLGLDVDIDLDACVDLDLGVSVDCEVDFGLDCVAKCSPLAVEAACIAELGEDCGLHEFAACQVDLLAHCAAGCMFGGSLFCDGDIYAGGGLCL